MAEKELILISHGDLCVEMKKSCELIMGPQEHIHTVSLKPEDGPETFLAKFNEVTKDWNPEDYIVFADLMGGTPANTIGKEIMEGKDIHMIAGMNLAMVIDWVNSQMIEMPGDYVKIAQEGIKDVNSALKTLINK